MKRRTLDLLICPVCHGKLILTDGAAVRIKNGSMRCSSCQALYPIKQGIPQFIKPETLSGLNRRFAQMYDWFSWGYRLFSRVAFAHLGMPEETARREITDRLDPHGGKVLEVSIGPGVNLPYLVKRPDVGEVFGLDISLGQLTHCQRYMRRHGWDVDLFLGNAEQLPFGDSIFDGVFHIGGINFFNNKKAAIDEMVRVARPGARLLIADENEKGAKGYEKFIPGFKKSFGGRRNQIVAPIDHVPGTMLELRFFNIWKGLFYCLEFRKPYKRGLDMRRNRKSITAAGIAATRAIESEKPEGERICYDPYARQFVPGWLYALTAFFVKIGYAERRGPGVVEFLVVRDRYIDDVLQDFIKDGLHQLVILGAGYDSRAYRIEGMKDRVRVFEVDHPATQQDKQARVRKVFGEQPVHVTYVSVDFNTQTLEQRLPESGFDLNLKTLFIWQGVSMYLTPEAVDATLAFVRHHSAPGSAIVFDYIDRLVLDGIQKHGEISNIHRYRFMTGEGLTFGIEEGTIEAFLKERGFRRVRNMDANDLEQVYFTGKNAGRKVSPGYNIVLAEI